MSNKKKNQRGKSEFCVRNKIQLVISFGTQIDVFLFKDFKTPVNVFCDEKGIFCVVFYHVAVKMPRFGDPLMLKSFLCVPLFFASRRSV